MGKFNLNKIMSKTNRVNVLGLVLWLWVMLVGLIPAQDVRTLMVRSNGVLATPTNFFAVNSNLLREVVGAGSISTNWTEYDPNMGSYTYFNTPGTTNRSLFFVRAPEVGTGRALYLANGMSWTANGDLLYDPWDAISLIVDHSDYWTNDNPRINFSIGTNNWRWYGHHVEDAHTNRILEYSDAGVITLGRTNNAGSVAARGGLSASGVISGNAYGLTNFAPGIVFDQPDFTNTFTVTTNGPDWMHRVRFEAIPYSDDGQSGLLVRDGGYETELLRITPGGLVGNGSGLTNLNGDAITWQDPTSLVGGLMTVSASEANFYNDNFVVSANGSVESQGSIDVIGVWKSNGRVILTNGIFTGNANGMTNFSRAALAASGAVTNGQSSFTAGTVVASGAGFIGDASSFTNVQSLANGTKSFYFDNPNTWRTPQDLGGSNVTAGAGAFYGNGSGLSNISLVTATGLLPMGTVATQYQTAPGPFLSTNSGARGYSYNAGSLTNMQSVRSGSISYALTDNTERFFSWSGMVSSSIETWAAAPMALGGTFSKFYLAIHQIGGAGTNITVKIYTNGVYCGLGATLRGAGTSTNDLSTVTGVVPDGALVSLGVQSSYNGTHPTMYFRWSWVSTK